ncbi:MAG: LCP family protein [Oscillospiraceae bacterium]|nr:LCP family protein [Oscillospiraceae bacterium]
MKKQPSIDFNPDQHRRREFLTRFALGFGVVLFMLAVLSAVALQRGDFFENLLNRELTTLEAHDPDAWAHTGETTLLIAVHDNAAQNLRMVFLLHVDIAQRRFVVEPVVAGEGLLDAALRTTGSVRGLQQTVDILTNTPTARYIAARDADFIRWINAMGIVPVQVNERIDHRGDFTLTLAEGSQRLQGDMLLRYFRYLGTHSAQAQAELFAHVLRTYLVPRHASSHAVLETRFGNLTGILTTDISHPDFFSRRDMLMALLAEPEELTIEVA